MLRTALATLLLALASAAFGSSCPLHMNAIDEALDDPAVQARLSQEELQEVRELRQEGEALHQQGQHDESVEVLTRAREILGIT